MRFITKITILTLLLIPSNTFASPKIGIVNMNKVLQESKSGKMAQKELDKSMNSYKDKLESKIKALESEKQKLAKQSSVISQDAFDEKLEKLQARDKDLKRQVMDLREDFSKKNNQYIGKIVEKTQEIFKELVEEEDYDFIFDKNVNFIVYSNSSVDVSSKVIEKLNSKKINF